MTPHFILRRLDYTPFATYGQLLDADERLVCVTLELPWLNNQRIRSCIPAGTYTAHRRLSPKRKYELFELDHVPERSNIEIHIGNLPKDSQGCILVGSNFGQIDGRPGILSSGSAFRRWMSTLVGVHTITITVEAPRQNADAGEGDES